MALADIEARCDLLQRRVNERAAGGAGGGAISGAVGGAVGGTSPSRPPATPLPTPIPHRATPATPAATSSLALGGVSPARTRSPPRAHAVSTAGPSHDGPRPTVSQAAAALSELRQEQRALRAKLEAVTLHIAVYEDFVARGTAPPPAPSAPPPALYDRPDGMRAQSPVRPLRYDASRGDGSFGSLGRERQEPAARRPELGLSSASSTAAWSPAAAPRDPSAPGVTGGATVQADAVYEELRLIRRAREEREAQRRVR